MSERKFPKRALGWLRQQKYFNHNPSFKSGFHYHVSTSNQLECYHTARTHIKVLTAWLQKIQTSFEISSKVWTLPIPQIKFALRSAHFDIIMLWFRILDISQYRNGFPALRIFVLCSLKVYTRTEPNFWQFTNWAELERIFGLLREFLWFATSYTATRSVYLGGIS